MADVLVFYTPAVRRRLGDATAVARIVQAAVDTNTAIGRSEISGSVRLVGVEELSFTEGTEAGIDLLSFSENTRARQRREALGADLVSLVTEARYGSTCGVAFPGPDANAAYSLIPEPCFNQYSFAHEVGHNFGAGHATDDPAPDGWQPYSHGHKSPSTTPRFRTVMAYDCLETYGVSCQRVLHYSSPDIRYRNHLTGTAEHDNARTLSEAFPLVEDFRATKAILEPPSPPLHPQGMVTGFSVFLSWQPPVTGIATNYRVVAGSTPGASNLFNGSVGTYLVLNTSAGPGTYYVRIVAENSLGVSPPSEELAIVVGGNDLIPGPPRSLKGQAFGDGVTLTWLAPNVGPTPSSYLIEVGSAPGTTDLVTFTSGGPFMYQGGVPNGLYYVRVRSQHVGLISAASNEVAVRVGPPAGCQPPGPPPGLTFSRSGPFVTLHWAPALSGSPPFSYIVEAGHSPTVANFFNGNVGPTTTVSATLPNGSYFIRTRTVNACGTSAPSMQVSFQVP